MIYNEIGAPTKMENESIIELINSIENRNEAVEIKALLRLAGKVTDDKEVLERFENILEHEPAMRKMIGDMILLFRADT